MDTVLDPAICWLDRWIQCWIQPSAGWMDTVLDPAICWLDRWIDSVHSKGRSATCTNWPDRGARRAAEAGREWSRADVGYLKVFSLKDTGGIPESFWIKKVLGQTCQVITWLQCGKAVRGKVDLKQPVKRLISFSRRDAFQVQEAGVEIKRCSGEAFHSLKAFILL